MNGYVVAKLCAEFARDNTAVSSMREEIWQWANANHYHLGLLVVTDLPNGDVEFVWAVDGVTSVDG